MPENKEVAFNPRTGEIFGDAGLIARLRELEEEITRADVVVMQCQDDLKAAKQDRDAAMNALRDAVKDQKPLPLLDEPPAEKPPE
jgi:hypothetical protein